MQRLYEYCRECWYRRCMQRLYMHPRQYLYTCPRQNSLYMEQFIIAPGAYIVFNVSFDALVGRGIFDDVIVVAFLPAKLRVQKMCLFGYCRFVRSDNGCQGSFWRGNGCHYFLFCRGHRYRRCMYRRCMQRLYHRRRQYFQDSMHMIWHDNHGMQFYIGKMIWNFFPARFSDCSYV